MTNLFSEIHVILRGEKNARGWYDADCPYCGKEAKPRQTHFGYRPDDGTGNGGFHCWVCGASGGLRALADRLNVRSDEPYTPARRESPPPKPIARWRQNPDRLLDGYLHHPDRYRLWAQHKPLRPETVDRFGFGVGCLPRQNEMGEWEMGKTPRLIVPLWQGDQLMALRGRAMRAEIEPKWISATGSVMVPWGLGSVTPGAIVWLCENYVDAAWLMQERPEWQGVGLGGVSTWKEEHGRILARAKPRLVVVALDNDLPGQAQGELRRRLESEWNTDPKHRGQPPPPSNGVRIVKQLRQMGVHSEMFQWPDDAPAKAGVDLVFQKRD
jgi:hypothetical protein